ncbi:MAG: Uma2 family endonuclease [Planctomycetes bacterium]|nr:Uma2 family endonuclease [Planctomycetota bacterium]
MASVLTKLMTAEEFYDFVHRPENRDRRFELEEGEVIEMSRPGEKHCVVCGNANGLLWTYTRQKKKGYVCSNDMGLILERDPDTVRGPDIAVYLESRKFDDLEVKYPERMPNLIVDVLSPSDRRARILRRVKKFLEKGVSMVWLLDPEEQSVTIYLPNQTPIVLEGDEEVTGQGVLPDFRCKASDFFVMPGM